MRRSCDLIDVHIFELRFISTFEEICVQRRGEYPILLRWRQRLLLLLPSLWLRTLCVIVINCIHPCFVVCVVPTSEQLSDLREQECVIHAARRVDDKIILQPIYFCWDCPRSLIALAELSVPIHAPGICISFVRYAHGVMSTTGN